MSNVLHDIIVKHIRLNGPLSVEAYWNLCMSHPEYGYYITRDPLGAQGDFTTAPEISQLFGEMVGIWVVEQWYKLGQPSAIYIVESGPGRGTLMADVLRIGKVVPDFIEATQIHLIETSPSLCAKQGEVLKGHQVVWHEDLSTLPDNAPLIVIGNEFLDALPIQQYVFLGGKWFERVIGLDDNHRLIWGLAETNYRHTSTITDDVMLEISPARESYIADISSRIKAQGGAALMIDYGHETPHFGDTFQAVKDHHPADVLADCGHVDLTSHVDFGQLKFVAERENLSVHLQSQRAFLRRMGIEQRAEQLKAKSETIESGLHRLIDADKMGELFRVMEIVRE